MKSGMTTDHYSCDNLKSDEMLFTNISYLHLKDKRTNDQQFIYQMSQPQNRCVRNIELEDRLWKDTFNEKKPFCSRQIDNRGNNAGCERNINCPKPMTDYQMKEWLLIPCACTDHLNYLIQDDKKICSRKHQFFKNVTKRKNVTGKEEIFKRYC
jgi:hypothetical protein